ncbi:MAG: diguanylate cyclase, partial [Lachnospiraceae bacterium]
MNMTKKEGVNEKLNLDAMTGLLNQSAIYEEVDQQLHKPRSRGGIIVLDVDDFKKINDNYGYWYGDYMLKLIGDRLCKETRKQDRIGRTGDNKFMILCPGCGKDKVVALADKILANCGGFSKEHNFKTPVTVSMGIAMYPYTGRDTDMVVKKAEAALYYVKRSGKNAFSLFRDILGKSSVGEVAKESIFPEYGRELSFQENIQTSIVWRLQDEENLGENIQAILERTALFLDAESASVLEVDVLGNCLYCAYEWSRNRELASNLNQYLLYSKSVTNQFINYYEIDHPMVVCENVEKEDMEDIYIYSLKKNHVASAVHMGVFVDGVLAYIFRFENYHKPRKWTEGQISFIKDVSEKVGMVLHKHQDKSRMDYFMDRFVNYDALTKLPTYAKFRRDAQRLFNENPDEEYVIIYTDFKNFKYINDAFGFAVGDEVLCEFADFMRTDNSKILLCRIAGDSFAALGLSDSQQRLMNVVKDCNRSLEAKLKQKYYGMNVVLVSGVCFFTKEEGFDDAIDHANYARREAKKDPKGGTILFDAKMKKELQRQSTMLNALDHAFEVGEFQVYYQPKICLQTDKIVGGEALIRWHKADGSIIYPDEFIPFCESNGVITRIDYFVLEQTCKMLRQWLDKEENVVPLSINLSRHDCLQPGFFKDVLEVVNRYQIPHELLEFEVTESVFLEDVTALGEFLQFLLDAGFEVSIDDFGSGYSSLNVL